MDKKTFWVVGGDRRQLALARLLGEDGHRVHTFALGPGSERSLEGIGRADCVVLPVPASGADGMVPAPLGAGEGCPVEMVLDALSAGQLVCAGMAGEELCTAAAARGLVLVDYFQREDLTVMNAVATAEGAIQLAMEELPVTLCGARALVVGFGRIGRLLAPRLAALGAEVTAAARRGEQRALARAMGLRAAGTEHMARILHSCTLAVNTAPAMVLGREELAALPEDALVIDLASPPGGVDFAAARALGVNALWARGLPGRVAPVSAAGYIRDAVYHIMEELGV